MIDNQILKENWFQKGERNLQAMIDVFSIRNLEIKRIPVIYYEELRPTDRYSEAWQGKSLVITKIGEKLYKKTIIGL